MDYLPRWLVAIILALVAGIIIATGAALSHDAHSIEDNQVEPSQHIEPNATNDYLETPGGKTKVFKFYDDVGAICFLAESSDYHGGVAIYCIPGAK